MSSDLVEKVKKSVFNLFGEDFSREDLEKLSELERTVEEAKEIMPGFEINEVIELIFSGIYPKEGTEYDERFGIDQKMDLDQRMLLKRDGIFPELANRYNKRFEFEDIRNFLDCSSHSPSGDRKIFPDEANNYHQRFIGRCVDHLARAGISPEEADTYPERFTGWDITELVKGDVSIEKALTYSERFSGWGM